MKPLFVKGKRCNLTVCVKSGHTKIDEKTVVDALYVLAPCGHYVHETSNFCSMCGMRVKEYMLSVFN